MDRLVRGHNGEKTLEPFTPAEMEDRQTKLRLHMAEHDIDASVLTSHHNICYFSGFMHCAFGRNYGLGRYRRQRHNRQRRYRRWPTLASNPRRQPHLHRLAQRQLLSCGPISDAWG